MATNAICRYRLYKLLGLTSKIPAAFSKTYENVDCPNNRGETVVTGQVIVRTADKGNGFAFKHRIFVKCGGCGREIPFGRWHQHNPSCRTGFRENTNRGVSSCRRNETQESNQNGLRGDSARSVEPKAEESESANGPNAKSG